MTSYIAFSKSGFLTMSCEVLSYHLMSIDVKSCQVRSIYVKLHYVSSQFDGTPANFIMGLFSDTSKSYFIWLAESVTQGINILTLIVTKCREKCEKATKEKKQPVWLYVNHV